jgi:hypothetical protein
VSMGFVSTEAGASCPSTDVLALCTEAGRSPLYWAAKKEGAYLRTLQASISGPGLALLLMRCWGRGFAGSRPYPVGSSLEPILSWPQDKERSSGAWKVFAFVT